MKWFIHLLSIASPKFLERVPPNSLHSPFKANSLFCPPFFFGCSKESSRSIDRSFVLPFEVSSFLSFGLESGVLFDEFHLVVLFYDPGEESQVFASRFSPLLFACSSNPSGEEGCFGWCAPTMFCCLLIWWNIERNCRFYLRVRAYFGFAELVACVLLNFL